MDMAYAVMRDTVTKKEIILECSFSKCFQWFFHLLFVSRHIFYKQLEPFIYVKEWLNFLYSSIFNCVIDVILTVYVY